MSEGTHAILRQMASISPLSLNKTFKGAFTVSTFSSGGGYSGELHVGTITQPYKYGTISITSVGTYDFSLEAIEVDIVLTFVMTGAGSSFILDNVSLKRFE
jgi:hypothetical protein